MTLDRMKQMPTSLKQLETARVFKTIDVIISSFRSSCPYPYQQESFSNIDTCCHGDKIVSVLLLVTCLWITCFEIAFDSLGIALKLNGKTSSLRDTTVVAETDRQRLITIKHFAIVTRYVSPADVRTMTVGLSWEHFTRTKPAKCSAR